MRIDFRGQLVDDKEIRAGFVGCGSHSFRNIFPTFQFAPVDLVATCDLDRAKAEAFAHKFGARKAYASYREMLEREQLDAVFVVTGYDETRRPKHVPIVVDCLAAGCHVWIEKPPAASCRDVETMRAAAQKAGRHVVCGLKKMFAPANERAKELMWAEDFAPPVLVSLQYPGVVPELDEMAAFLAGERASDHVVSFLDHLCHPASLLVFLMGMPATLFYERARNGACAATFAYGSGAVASLHFTQGAAENAGMERTLIVSGGPTPQHIVVDNNIRLAVHRAPRHRYGASPDFFTGTTAEASTLWEPEFSLGQLYNKGLFLLGYYNEVNEFARAILDERPPSKGHLDHMAQVTRLFEAFAEGPGKRIPL